MTYYEMETRFRQLGGKNAKNALIISIEKWKAVSRWRGKRSDAADDYPGDGNCALCVVHCKGASCGLCPLRPLHRTHGCSGGTLYRKWLEANRGSTLYRARSIARALVAEMESAYADRYGPTRRKKRKGLKGDHGAESSKRSIV